VVGCEESWFSSTGKPLVIETDQHSRNSLKQSCFNNLDFDFDLFDAFDRSCATRQGIMINLGQFRDLNKLLHFMNLCGVLWLNDYVQALICFIQLGMLKKDGFEFIEEI
jgi:hypothetical protein